MFFACQEKKDQNKELIGLKDKLREAFINRNPRSVNLLHNHFLDSLIRAIPPSSKNIDTYYQIDYMLGFLDSRFADYYFESRFHQLGPSKQAYDMVIDYPFFKEDVSAFIAAFNQHKGDTLLLKYILHEENLKTFIINKKKEIDKEKLVELKEIVVVLKENPIKLQMERVSAMLYKIEDELINTANWQGTYSFDYGRTHMGQYTEGNVRFNITEDSQKVFFDEKEVNLTIKKAYKDSIILNQGDDYDYILFRIAPDEYAVKGHHIYMLSPPNEVQNLTKH